MPLCCEDFPIERDTIAFHPCEHRNQRDFHFVEQPRCVDLGHRVLKRLLGAEGDFCIFCCIECCLVQGHRGNLAVLAGKLLIGEHLIAQVDPCDLLQVVAALFRARKMGGDHRVKADSAGVEAVPLQHDQIVLQVLPDDTGNIGFNEGTEGLEDHVQRKLVRNTEVLVTHRDVGAFVRLGGKRDSDNARPHRVAARRFQIQREFGCCGDLCD